MAEARMAESPVVALLGPRSVGKSTLTRHLARLHGGARIVDLDQGLLRANVIADPGLFVAGQSPVFIDKYQKAPGVLDAIKAELNLDPRAGRFVLTGSTRFDALPTTAQALTGRTLFVPIQPFSQGELASLHEDFLDTALTDPALHATGIGAATERTEYAERICAGGMPSAVGVNPKARAPWFDEYTDLSLH